MLGLVTSESIDILQVGFDIYDPAISSPLLTKDFILGGRGNNRLFSRAVDEVIDGGQGHDTLVVAGSRHGFSFAAAGSDVAMSGLASGDDLLRDVEAVRFDDILLPLAWLLDDTVSTAEDEFATLEDTALSLVESDLLGNDLFGFAGTREAVVVLAPTEGLLVGNPSGSWSYTPATDFGGTDVFNYDTRLRFLDNARTTDGGGLIGDSDTGLPRLAFNTLPTGLNDHEAYQIRFDILSIDVDDADLALALDGTNVLTANELASSDLSGASGMTLTFDFVQLPELTGLEFILDGASPGATGQIELTNFQIVQSATGDLVVNTNVYDGQDQSVTIHVTPVADIPHLTVAASADGAGFAPRIDLVATLADTDGSEELTIELHGLEDAMTATDGSNLFVATPLATSVDISGWDLNQLSVRNTIGGDEDVEIIVTAVATESENGDSAAAFGAVTVQAGPELVNISPDVSEPASRSVPAPPPADPPPAPVTSTTSPSPAVKPTPGGLDTGADGPAAVSAAKPPAATGGDDPAESVEKADGDADPVGESPMNQNAESSGSRDEQPVAVAPPLSPFAQANHTAGVRALAGRTTAPGTPPSMAIPAPSTSVVTLVPETPPRRFLVAGESDVVASFDTAQLFEACDEVGERVADGAEPPVLLAGTAVVLAVGFSATQVAWLLRGGLFLSRLLTSMPLWFSFDPLPILNSMPDLDDYGDDATARESLVDIAAAADRSEISHLDRVRATT